MLRILVLHTRYRYAGGEDSVVAREIDTLEQAGYSVALHEEKNPDGLAAAVSLPAALWNPRAAARFEDAADRFLPDVVHLHNPWFAMSASVAASARRRGVPLVMTLHNYRLVCANALLYRSGSTCQKCVDGSAWNGLWHGCYRDPLSSSVAAATVALHRQLRTWARSVSRFLVQTAVAKDVFERAGIPAGSMTIKPNFVGDPGRRVRPASESQRLLYIGRLSAEKGIERLLDAWKRRRPTDLSLSVAGDGPLADRVRAAEGVEYLGQVPREEVRALLLDSRALVFPTQVFESQPMILLEALSAGLPVLGSSIGATAELLSPLGNRWLVDPHDVDAWVSGFEMLEDPGLVDHGSRVARQVYEKAHTPSDGLARLEEIYQGVTAVRR